jgi:DNA repair protein RecO (recombination protein O)
MKQTDKGLVLNRFSYSETSLMIKCLTESNGLKSFLFQGAKKKKGLVISPLMPIEFTYYQKEEHQLAKMTDARLTTSFQSIPFDPVKSTILFFEVDILTKVLHEGDKDSLVYDYILEELHWLDSNNDLTNYPIYWLLYLSKTLGFYPHKIGDKTPYFDLEEGEFSSVPPQNLQFKTGYEIELLSNLIPCNKSEILGYKIPKTIRKTIIHILLAYYKLHIPNFRNSNALEIIETIWE